MGLSAGELDESSLQEYVAPGTHELAPLCCQSSDSSTLQSIARLGRDWQSLVTRFRDGKDHYPLAQELESRIVKQILSLCCIERVGQTYLSGMTANPTRWLPSVRTLLRPPKCRTLRRKGRDCSRCQLVVVAPPPLPDLAQIELHRNSTDRRYIHPTNEFVLFRDGPLVRCDPLYIRSSRRYLTRVHAKNLRSVDPLLLLGRRNLVFRWDSIRFPTKRKLLIASLRVQTRESEIRRRGLQSKLLLRRI